MTQGRIAGFLDELISRTRALLVEHDIGYDDYERIKGGIVAVGKAGEWDLLLDILFESTVEVHNANRAASPGAVQGPFYVPESPLLPARCSLPRAGGGDAETLRLTGGVRSADGTPLAGAVLDVWQSDEFGLYSHFAPGIPDFALRGRVVTDDEGRFDIGTIVPGAYQVPVDGPSGRLFALLGLHAWRPAHVHFIITAPGHEPLTTQLYFAGDPWLETDVANGVKDELVLRPAVVGDKAVAADYDFVLAPGSSRP
ncbi:catechol 1,2-dioxygenase [Actinosynnema sp. NPDC050436]|uniref:dioxygenase family protein n=1 Tax=Actinosynnema sp. NPDC050436 TaxID=3155659 RepID=UPI003407EE49